MSDPAGAGRIALGDWLRATGRELLDRDLAPLDAWTATLALRTRVASGARARYVSTTRADILDELAAHGVGAEAVDRRRTQGLPPSVERIGADTTTHRFADVVMGLDSKTGEPHLVRLHADEAEEEPLWRTASAGWTNLDGRPRQIETPDDPARHAGDVWSIEALASVAGVSMAEPMLMCIGRQCTLQDGPRDEDEWRPRTVGEGAIAHLLAGMALRIPQGADTILVRRMEDTGSATIKAAKAMRLRETLPARLRGLRADPLLVAAVERREWESPR